MQTGYLSLVLNAHLPFVRHPEHPRFLEERWLFEAVSETYLPLLRLFRKLEDEGIPFTLSMSISPTLAAMLSDPLLQERYIAYLDSQLELADKELKRTAGDPAFAPLATLYRELYKADRDDYVSAYGKNILGAFDYYYKKGRIDLLTTAASHAFLPMYRSSPEAIAAQIETALVAHRRAFGKQPSGFWLPHLGWFPGLDEVLRAYNINYTVVTTKGGLLGRPIPAQGSFSPVHTPSGLAVFIRDAAATEAVWSERSGYPSDPAYREFYRDIGFDLPLDYVGPYLAEGPVRIFTGFKYWAITGKTVEKRPYDPGAARARARKHAESFLEARSALAESASRFMERPPLMVCPYDAELFGHWWFEGPIWLENLFSAAAASDSIRLVTLGEYHRLYPEAPRSQPEFSSWGDGGYGEVWLDGANDWVYRHTYKVLERMSELAERFPDESGLRERILNQAAREALLAMGSDWPLLLRSGQSEAFARSQIQDAISNFGLIYEMLCSNTVETEWITTLEKRNNIFPTINYRMFRKKR